MTDYKYIRIFGILTTIGFIISMIFNLGVLFFIFYLLLIGLFIMKFYYYVKRKEFKNRKKMIILHRLLLEHCKGKKIKEKWYKKAKYIDGCINYTKKECMNRYSSKRVFCIGNYVFLMRSFQIIQNNHLSGKKLVKFINKYKDKIELAVIIGSGKNEKK